MNREIKFEVVVLSRMDKKLIGISEPLKLEDVGFYLRKRKDNDKDCIEYYEYRQYTGLEDKNDKEIYEGDILKSEYESIGIPKRKNCHPVIWSNGRWDCDHSINDCCKPWRGDLNGHHLSEEIIGNIYENPELLKP